MIESLNITFSAYIKKYCSAILNELVIYLTRLLETTVKKMHFTLQMAGGRVTDKGWQALSEVLVFEPLH